MSEAAAMADSAEGGFRTRTVVWLLVVSVAAALAFAALSVFAPQIRQSQDAGAHALSHSAVGYAGLVQILKSTGHRVSVSRGVQGSAGLDLLILTPPPGATADQINALADKAGVVLILAPKWVALPDGLHPGWVTNYGLQGPKSVSAPGREELKGVNRKGGQFSPVLTPRPDDAGILSAQSFSFGPIDSFQTMANGKAQVALMDQTGAPVLLKALRKARPGAQAPASDDDEPDDGHIYVLTDPDLLNNHGLANLQTARAAVALVERLSGKTASVTFDVTLNGFRRDRSLLRLALEPPFLAATLCILGAAFLMGWRTVANFGPTERRGRAVALGKRALVDSAAGLIRMTRRAPRMAPRYAVLIRSATLAAVGAREQSPEASDAYLDRLAQSAGAQPFTRLVAQANQTRTEAELMRSAQALSKWKSEVVRER